MLYFRRFFFLRRAGGSPPYHSRSRCNRLRFLDLLSKGQLDAGEVERRKDIRMRGVFKVGDQRKGDEDREVLACAKRTRPRRLDGAAETAIQTQIMDWCPNRPYRLYLTLKDPDHEYPAYCDSCD